jgi:hypothetical protein
LLNFESGAMTATGVDIQDFLVNITVGRNTAGAKKLYLIAE